MSDITPQDAKAMLDEGNGAVYLDVRSVPEFEQGHVPGAINIPLIDMDATGRMAPNPDFVRVVTTHLSPEQTIVVGCKAGPRSQQAVQIMQQIGFPNAMNMLGGFAGCPDVTGQMVNPGWLGMDYPVATTPEPGKGYADLRGGCV